MSLTAAADEARILPDAPRPGWSRFWALTFPACLLAFALAAEGAAYALRGVQPLRNSLDAIAAAAERAPGHARWLIFGDSLTQHVLMDVSAGPPDEVTDLATHAGAGLPSMYLLLKRYLATHKAPDGIVLVLSPEVLSDVPDDGNGRFWLVPTFLHPDEQAWLAQFYPSAGVRPWRPAAANLKHAILDPLTGVLGNTHPHFPQAPREASSQAVLEAPVPLDAAREAAIRVRGARHLQLARSAAVIADICRTARDAGVGVRLLVAPVPAKLHAIWSERGDLARLTGQVADVMRADCPAGSRLDDMSNVVQPPNFDAAGTHIEGIGWENRFASWLRDYLKA